MNDWMAPELFCILVVAITFSLTVHCTVLSVFTEVQKPVIKAFFLILKISDLL